MKYCPSLDQLQQLLENHLNEAEAEAIESHIDACAVCQQALERLTEMTRLNGMPETALLLPIGAVGAVVESGAAFLRALEHDPPTGLLPNHEAALGSDTTRTLAAPASTASARPPPTVAGYEIIKELGRGGMGIVYQARQLGLNRLVALKMILAGAHADDRDRARFRAEGEAVARLQHPHIVQIYEVGEAAGFPFFSLEFVDGDSLAGVLKGAPQVPAEAAQLVQILAETMQYAHEHGVVHRDLKPANVLLAVSRQPSASRSNKLTADSCLLTATPKITDFGLAKYLDGTSDRTVSGTIMGTPSYMPPEQAAGSVRGLGPGADVYALAAILYELLTGRPPFRGATVLDTLDQVRTQEPVPPRRLQPKVPADLETICLKGLHKEVARRYTSARALAEDLRRFLSGEPILARPTTSLERMAHWVKRRPVRAAVLAMTVCVLAVSLPGVTWLWQRAETKALAETKANQELTRETYYHRIGLAQSALAANNVGRAEELLDGAAPGLRGWEWHHLKRLRFGPPLSLTGHDGRVMSVAFTADGTQLASAGFDGSVKIHEAATGKELLDMPAPTLPTTLFGIAVSPDCQNFATASGVLKGLSGVAKIWDLRSGQRIHTLRGHSSIVQSVAYSPDGTRLASASWDGTVKLWNAATGQELYTLKGHTDAVQAVAYSPKGAHVASASWDRTVRIWDTATGQQVRSLGGSKNGLFAVAYSPDARYLAAGGSDGVINVWEAETGQRVFVAQADFGAVLSIAYTADGSRLAAAGMGKTIQVWDATSGKEILTLRGHTDLIGGLAFSRDGRLASASWDGSVRLWDATPLQQAPPPELRTWFDDDMALSVAFQPGGPGLAHANNDGGVKIWHQATQEVRKLRGHDKAVLAVAFRPDGKHLASAGADKTLKIWDAGTGAEIRAFPGIAGTDVKYSPDGKLLAAAVEKYVKIWDPATGKELLSFAAEQFACYGLAFAPDGQRLATVGWDQVVRVWDATTGQSLHQFKGHEHFLTRVAFSPDGRLLASGGWDGTVKIWEADKDGAAVHTFRHGDRVMSLAIHPNGGFVASAGMDGAVKIWNLRTGDEEVTLRGHMGAVWCVDFDADGRRLISGSGYRGKGEIKLWDTKSLKDYGTNK